MLIKAGTYRFNPTLTEAEVNQDIDVVVTGEDGGASIELYFSKIATSHYNQTFLLTLYIYKMVIHDGDEEIVEEVEEPMPYYVYGVDGWEYDEYRNHTITKDTDVADDFGAWYIANTRPINDETVKIENVIVFDEYGFKLSCNEVWGEIDGALNYIVVDTIPTDNILITDVNANVINMYYICDIDRIGTYDGANWNMYNATLIEDEAEAVDVGSPIAYVVVTYADGKEETPKKFTRLYLGDVAYSSNGKRFRKLQTDEPIITTLSATLPVKVGAIGVGTVGENIYLFGGLNDRYYPENAIYKFDTKTNSLTTPSATLPYTLYGIACGVVGTDIYLFGGNSTDAGKEIHKYDTITDTLTTLSTKMPVASYYMTCGVVGTNIYLFGGRGRNDVNTIYKFDTTTNKLTKLSETLPYSMGSITCGVVGTDIYLFGGINDEGRKKTICKFDTLTDTLITLSVVLPDDTLIGGCGVIDTDIYLFGGSYWGNPLNTIYKYNTITDSLELLTITLPVALSGPACGVVGTNIYLFGGQNDSGCTNTIYKYKAK